MWAWGVGRYVHQYVIELERAILCCPGSGRGFLLRVKKRGDGGKPEAVLSKTLNISAGKQSVALDDGEAEIQEHQALRGRVMLIRSGISRSARGVPRPVTKS